MKSIPQVPRGSYQIIRVDGTVEAVLQKPTIRSVYAAIGCECVDTVTLDRDKLTVMMVDDAGMIDGKPKNPKATALMKEAFGPGYPNPICGDVALVNDEDFA